MSSADPSEPTATPYAFSQVVQRYEVIDPAATTHRGVYTFRLRALSPFRFFEQRYYWTGSGVERDPEVLPVEDDPHSDLYRLHGPVLRNGPTRVFLVDLARELARDEKASVQWQQDLIDRHKTFEPRLANKVRKEIGELTLEVALPPALRLNVRATAIDLVTEEPLHPPIPLEPLALEEDIFRVKIAVPMVGVKYAIEWT
jgi:hypothetical protein